MTQDKYERARSNAKAWFQSIEEMVTELDHIRNNESVDGKEDDARQKIEESVLSVQVRGGWHNPGNHLGEYEVESPEEFEILLSTGGPALRIFGRLDQHCQPESAEMQMQDWGTPWERYPAPEATLLSFASVFWFGE